MRFLTRLSTGLTLAVLFCLPAFAQERPPIETALGAAASPNDSSRERDTLRDLIHCLKVLDLTEAQKTAIQQFIDGEKPALQSLHDTLKADYQTLETDAGATPPDPCKVGADFLTVVSDRQAIRAEIGKIKDFIVGQLTAGQKARFEGCLDAHASTAAGRTR